jgi:hypothetical protein
MYGRKFLSRDIKPKTYLSSWLTGCGILKDGAIQLINIFHAWLRFWPIKELSIPAFIIWAEPIRLQVIPV